jgi:hypothetical protein
VGVKVGGGKKGGKNGGGKKGGKNGGGKKGGKNGGKKGGKNGGAEVSSTTQTSPPPAHNAPPSVLQTIAVVPTA